MIFFLFCKPAMSGWNIFNSLIGLISSKKYWMQQKNSVHFKKGNFNKVFLKWKTKGKKIFLWLRGHSWSSSITYFWGSKYILYAWKIKCMESHLIYKISDQLILLWQKFDPQAKKKRKIKRTHLYHIS